MDKKMRAIFVTILFAMLIPNLLTAQKSLKILKDDGSETYINADAINKITIEDPLAIGDSYQGGIIFYLDASGEHGLIAAPTDYSSYIQMCDASNLYNIIGADGDGIGEGLENTYIIAGYLGDATYAAKVCSDLEIDGYTDWYLPSITELGLMENQMNIIGGFSTTSYWSSTECYIDGAYSMFFGVNDHSHHCSSKKTTLKVRAIRAF